MKKWMRRVVPGVLIGLSLAAGVVAGPVVLMPGPVDLEAGESRRQLWLLPSQDPAVPMQTTVFRPPGEGPFPLVLMNHGTTRNELERIYFPLLEFNAAAEWFAERKYAVVAPQRPGHGDTESGGLGEGERGDELLAIAQYGGPWPCARHRPEQVSADRGHANAGD